MIRQLLFDRLRHALIEKKAHGLRAASYVRAPRLPKPYRRWENRPGIEKGADHVPGNQVTPERARACRRRRAFRRGFLDPNERRELAPAWAWSQKGCIEYTPSGVWGVSTTGRSPAAAHDNACGGRVQPRVSTAPLPEILFENQQARFKVRVEVHEILEPFSQQRFDDRRRAVASLDPDDFRRRAEHERPRIKVRVLRDDDESMGAGVLPHGRVVSAPKPQRPVFTSDRSGSRRRPSGATRVKAATRRRHFVAPTTTRHPRALCSSGNQVASRFEPGNTENGAISPVWIFPRNAEASERTRNSPLPGDSR